MYKRQTGERVETDFLKWVINRNIGCIYYPLEKVSLHTFQMCIRDRLKGSLRMVGNHSQSAKAEGSLTATPTGGAGTKVGLSDPVV